MKKYAVVETGGKQYTVKEGDLLDVEKLDTGKSKMLKLEKVLLACDGKKVEIGRPHLKNVKVSCEKVGIVKGEKKIAFKYRRRKSSKSTRGHRQQLLRLKVKEISV